MLGLGEEAVVPVPVDRSRRMDPAALSSALADSVALGDVPMAVVATAGTTDFGAIDPLPEVAALARAYGAWFHVDAAYGGGLLVSRRRRGWLDGIELSDSVAVDFHKTWFQPVSCSALLVRDGSTLGHVTWHADYLNPQDSAHPNQVDKSLQTTRRFEALKLWMTLRVMGADAVGDHLDAVIDLTDAVGAELTVMPDIDVAAAPQLSTIVFRHAPAGLDEAALARHNAAIRAELFDEGRALVAATKVDGRSYLKLTLLNPMATPDDVLGVVDLVREAGQRAGRTRADRPAGGAAMTTEVHTHDLLGIGVGPFNLGLACLADPVADLDAVFLDAADGFSWHPGMMLPDATLQVPFMADLVTLADPTSRFSYLAFLKDVGRLYPFYIRESFYPLRREYDDYCRWAAERLDSVRWGERVVAVEHDGEAYVVRSATGRTWRARHLVLGTGTAPRLPFDVDGPALHSADYLARKDELLAGGSVTVVGSGQSAAEVYADLLAEQEAHRFELSWVTRSPRFFPMEYTKLTLEMTSPEWSSYFQSLPAPRRAEVQRGQAALSKGISSETINAIFDELYRREATGGVDTTLLTATEVTAARWDGSAYALDLRHTEQGDDRPDDDRPPRPRHRLRAARARLPRPGPRPDPVGRQRPVPRGPDLRRRPLR